MLKYSTVQGDTWDLISYKHYGNEYFMPPLLEANVEFQDTVIFSSSTILTIPPLPASYVEAADIPPWREE